ncbi:hypothetical protein BU15DRAFT_77336 [Melanogaster broomeanus]|nr:hypothetical protein BU15DRAFT_77336 [Melanogaster broomeanus]
MPRLIPSTLASVKKALACLPFVLRRQAARNVLCRVISFVLRVLQFCTSLLSRLEVAGRKYQRTNTGCGIISKPGVDTRGDLLVEDSSTGSQLPTSIHTLLDPSSEEVIAQEASPPAIDPSHQNSPQPTKLDTPSLRYPPSTAENSRATSPGPPQPTDSENTSSRVQQPVSQPECGGPERQPSHPLSEPQNQVGLPSPSDLLALAKPIVPGQLQRYNRKVKINQTHYTEEIPPYKLGYTEPEVPGWVRHIHPEGTPYFVSYRRDGNVQCICTDTDLSVPRHLSDVEDFIRVLVDAVARIQDPDYADLTLVLELSYEESWLVVGHASHLLYFVLVSVSMYLDRYFSQNLWGNMWKQLDQALVCYHDHV